MSGPFKAYAIGNKRFAAPDIAVRPVACTIEHESDDPPLDSIFRKAGCDVRMVMLNTHDSDALLPESPFRGQIIGVKIVRDDFRFDLEDPRKMRDGIAEEIETVDVFEIADMLAQEREVVARHADRYSSSLRRPQEFAGVLCAVGVAPARSPAISVSVRNLPAE